MTVDPPLVVGLPTRVRLVEPIGVGASSSVWRARDTGVGLDVAVKLLPSPALPGVGDVDERAVALHRARFEREGRALARLHGVPGIVALHELGVAHDGTGWLVMDLAAPGSLRDRLVGDASDDVGDPGAGPTPGLEWRELGAELASALARAHSLGVVHGDLSPANVLFSHDGAPLLADFGMAALLGGGAGTGGVAGFTAAYAAPERLRGAPPDRASDVYALAATLWHVATGAPPSGPLAAGAFEAGELLAPALAERAAERPSAEAFARSFGAATGRGVDGVAPPPHASRGRWRRR